MNKEIKIALFSDTHCRTDFLHQTNVDMVLHTGDITENEQDNLKELEKALEYFDQFYRSTPIKVLIAGNHDFALASQAKEAQWLLKKFGWTYLQDSGFIAQFNDGTEISIWGSPFMPPCWGVFNSPSEERIKYIERIPFGTEILMTHSGPFGILSSGIRGMEFGDELLLGRLPLLKPKIHAFGHVHESKGYLQTDDTLFLNSALGTLYKKPILISWPNCTVIS